jgi:predicted nucleic acid-binding protein
MHHVFIDTNVFLDFYRESQHKYDKDKLDNILNKFIEKSDTYKVYVTDYLKDEIFRNRAKVLKEQSDELSKKLKLTNGFSTVVRSLSTYDQFQKDLKSLEKSYQQLSNEFLKNSKDRLFDQDKFLSDFFEIYPIHQVSDAEKLAARDRFDFGYPPGKKDSYGDALNWLYLLSAVPINTDLYLVSRDKDFSNPLEQKEINPYLAQEWHQKKNGKIIYLDSIVSLIHILDSADEEFEKTYISEQLDKLVNSPNFAETHSQISKLKSFVGKFTQEQIVQFITGFYKNPQINWISSDTDVKEFLRLIKANSHYSKELRETIKHELHGEEEEFNEAD